MNKHFQPGQHLDADQLNSFIEGVLPEEERLESLAHLAECEECRRVAFLAQRALPAQPTVAVKAEPVSLWQRWFRPAPLVGVAAACALLVAVSVDLFRDHRGKSKITYETKNAVVVPSPQPAAAAPPSQPRTEAQAAAKIPPPEAKAPSSSKAMAMPVAPSQQPKLSGVPGGVMGGVGNGVMGGILGGLQSAPPPAARAAVVPPPSPPSSPVMGFSQRRQPSAVGGPIQAVRPDIARAPLEELPMSNRTPGGVVTRNGPLNLVIEHDRGPDNGLSEVTGSVKDASGAVISGATITLRSSGGTFTTGATTDAQGNFTMAGLPGGQYEMQIVSPGFQMLLQHIELKPRDLAQVSSTMVAGAATQTVVVNPAPNTLETETAELKAVITEPGRPPLISSVSSNNRELAVDSAGALFLSEDGGKKWKKIKPKWHGKAMQLSTIHDAKLVAGEAVAKEGLVLVPRFQLSTSSGEVWVSADGRHWQQR